MTPDERPTAKPIHLQQEMVKHLLNIIQNVLAGTSPPPPHPQSPNFYFINVFYQTTSYVCLLFRVENRFTIS